MLEAGKIIDAEHRFNRFMFVEGMEPALLNNPFAIIFIYKISTQQGRLFRSPLLSRTHLGSVLLSTPQAGEHIARLNPKATHAIVDYYDLFLNTYGSGILEHSTGLDWKTVMPITHYYKEPELPIYIAESKGKALQFPAQILPLFAQFNLPPSIKEELSKSIEGVEFYLYLMEVLYEEVNRITKKRDANINSNIDLRNLIEIIMQIRSVLILYSPKEESLSFGRARIVERVRETSTNIHELTLL